MSNKVLIRIANLDDYYNNKEDTTDENTENENPKPFYSKV